MGPGDTFVGITAFLTIGWVMTSFFRHWSRRKQLRAPQDDKRLEQMEKEKKLLEDRVRNLESIVCSVDMELNARLNRLAQVQTMTVLPAKADLPPPQLGPQLAPGKVLVNRYHVERELGRGGFGAVYLARDAQMGELVAVKVMAAPVDGMEAAERFRREAQAARKITHPNVIRIHDLGEDAQTGMLFLSMEYFPGLTLAEVLRRRGGLPLEEVRELAGQICDGLEAAHKSGVVHRDLKPGNVLVNEKRSVKIIDFGLAKATAMAGMTATGLIMGSPEYMAPEQIRGREVDARTDLYALGACLYHMVTGMSPFRGDSPIAVGFAHCTQPVRPPRELRPDLPEAMQAAILRALAKEPRDRFSDVGELRRELCGNAPV